MRSTVSLLILACAGLASAQPAVGVGQGPGVWAPGRAALVAALETAGVELRPLELEGLRAIPPELDAVVLPGGWAPTIRAALGDEGAAALGAYVRGGGGCLAICAGAYLVSHTVRWEGVESTYPIGLFPGVAAGPVAGLAPWPERGPVELTRVEGEHALQGLGTFRACYYGGPSLDAGGGVPLLRYPDGTAAAVALTCGRGRLVLIGPHLELAPDTSEPAPPALELLRSFVRWVAGASSE